MSQPSLPWRVGQGVILTKSHPCGGRGWTVYKLGMDVGLQCQRCGQRIKLARRKFERAVAHELPDPLSGGMNSDEHGSSTTAVATTAVAPPSSA
jgi:hypothetical protein